MTNQTQLELRQRLEEHMTELPSLPTVVAQLMTLDRDDEDYFDKLLATLESDPNLSARVMARANSASGGSRVPITTLRAALGRIGSQTAANLVLSMAMTNVFIPRDEWEKSLWRHAIQVATAARELALYCKDAELDADEAYACGLLHDIGRFVMFHETPDELKQIDEADWDEPEGLVHEEMSTFGITHSYLGALACRRWGIAESIAQLVEDHHSKPVACPEGQQAKLTAVVQVADIAMFPSAMPGTPGLEDADDETLRDEVVIRLPPFIKIEIPELRRLLKLSADKARTATEALGVG